MRFAQKGLGCSLLDRYILAEIIPPLGLSVGIFASLGVAIGYLSDLANKMVESDLPLWEAAEILLLKVPEFVAYALPVSVFISNFNGLRTFRLRFGINCPAKLWS